MAFHTPTIPLALRTAAAEDGGIELWRYGYQSHLPATAPALISIVLDFVCTSSLPRRLVGSLAVFGATLLPSSRRSLPVATLRALVAPMALLSTNSALPFAQVLVVAGALALAFVRPEKCRLELLLVAVVLIQDLIDT